MKMLKLKGWKMGAFVGAVVLAAIGSGYGLYQLYQSWKTPTASGT